MMKYLSLIACILTFPLWSAAQDGLLVTVEIDEDGALSKFETVFSNPTEQDVLNYIFSLGVEQSDQTIAIPEKEQSRFYFWSTEVIEKKTNTTVVPHLALMETPAVAPPSGPPFLGVEYIQGSYGASIEAVIPNTGAEKAGLEAGELIVMVDEEQVHEWNPLYDIISRHKPGDKVKLTLVKEGRERVVTAEIGTRKYYTTGNFYYAPEPQEKKYRLGVYMGYDCYGEGACIGEVISSSAAEKMGLQTGDLVVSMNSTTVKTFEELRALVDAETDGSTVTFKINRDGQLLEVSGNLEEIPTIENYNPYGDLEDLEGLEDLEDIEDAEAPEETITTSTETTFTKVSVKLEWVNQTAPDRDLSAEPIQGGFSVSPNPTTGIFQISSIGECTGDYMIQVMDMQGKLARYMRGNVANSRISHEMNITSMPAGTYMVEITHNGEIQTVKVIKQ